jgi:hypothetical protein
MNLPRGAQTWVALGGRAAISDDVESSWLVEHALYSIAWGQGGRKGEKPKFRDYPPGLLHMAEKARIAASRADAFRAKHHNK